MPFGVTCKRYSPAGSGLVGVVAAQLPAATGSGCLKTAPRSIVPAVFYAAAFFPSEDDPVGIDDGQGTRHKAGIAKFLLGDLSFALQGAQVGPPSDLAGGHVFVAGDLHRFGPVAVLGDLDDLVVVT